MQGKKNHHKSIGESNPTPNLLGGLGPPWESFVLNCKIVSLRQSAAVPTLLLVIQRWTGSEGLLLKLLQRFHLRVRLQSSPTQSC